MKNFIPLPFKSNLTDDEMQTKALEYNQLLQKRRTVRDFSDKPVAKEVIEQCILAAGSAPSGAHMQPWHFVAIGNKEIKSKIRIAAEIEEKEFYEHRASEEWLKALEPLGTDTNKPFLETAPWLIAVFAERYGLDENGKRIKHYYTPESVGISCGMLISALHASGLATLTHTPSPMGFLKEILKRPNNERPYLLVVCGHPADDATVPNLKRLDLNEVSSFFE
ncbi:MAG: nitroreductase family protein [Marinicellaceae bacterium]